MSDVFISYSRKDIAFARLIREALQESQVDTWIDWERIPVGERWWQEICRAIQNANVFMFIISQSSVGSKVCKDEIEQALKNNKRIIPIVVDNLSPDAIRDFAPELPEFNWIIFEKDRIFQIQENPEARSDKPEERLVALPKLPQFQEALKKLSEAIHTDWEWVKFHTQLQVEALRWESNQHNASYLIGGTALEDAEQQVLRASGKDPQPTALQAEFISASRQEETRRQQEKLLLEQKARQRQRFALWAVGIGLAVAVVLGILAWGQRNEAVEQSNVRATAEANAVAEANSRATAESKAIGEANARATAQAVAEEQRNTAQTGLVSALALGQANTRYDLALLLSSAAFKKKDTFESRRGLLDVLKTNPELQYFLFGHRDTIYDLDISPDKTWIVSASEDGTAILWDTQKRVAAGMPLLVDGNPVTSAAFSPDSKLLATGNCTKTDPSLGCAEGKVFLWEVSTGNQIGDMNGLHVGSPLSLAFSHDGRLLASGDTSGQIRLWDTSSLSLVGGPMRREVGAVLSLAFSPDDSSLLSAVRMMDFSSGTAASPVSYHGKIRLWNVSDRQSTDRSADCPGAYLLAVSFGADGSPLGAFDLGNQIYIWNLNRLDANPDSVGGFNGFISTLEFSPNGSKLASGGCSQFKSNGISCIQGEVRLWDVNSMTPINPPLQGTSNYVTSLAFSQDGNMLAGNSAIQGGENSILVWDFSAPFLGWEIPGFMMPGQLAYSPDGRFLAVSSGNTISLISEAAGNGGETRELKNPGYVTSLAFNETGNYLAAGSSDQFIYLWDVANNLMLMEPLMGQPDSVAALVFDDGEGSLVSAGKKGALLVWDMESGELLEKVLGESETAQTAVAISPDGKILAGAFCLETNPNMPAMLNCAQVEIRLVDVQTGELLYEPIRNQTSQINVLAFSRDGRWLATAGCGHVYREYDCDQGEVRVYEVSTGKLATQPLQEHTENVVGLAFGPDGKILASMSDEANVILWDIGQWFMLGQLDANSSMIPDQKFSMIFSPGSNRLFTSHWTLSKWSVSPGEWQAMACQKANRELTPVEWTQYFPGEEYQSICLLE